MSRLPKHKFAILTPKRLQSDLMIQKLAEAELIPVKVYYFQNHQHSKPMAEFVKEKLRKWIYHERTIEKIKRQQLQNQKEANKILKGYAAKSGVLRIAQNIEAVWISDVNHFSFADELRNKGIEYLIIWGIPVLQNHILQAVNKGVINSHTAILSEYRGVRPEFWQFYDQSFSHAGISIHLADEHVDTGDILYQEKALPEECKNPEVLRMHNSIRIIEAMPKVLKDLFEDKIKPMPQSELAPPATPTHRFRDAHVEELMAVYLNPLSIKQNTQHSKLNT